MLIELKEVCYKVVEVPDDTTIEDVECMLETAEIVVADTMDADFYVKFPGEDWEGV